MKRKRQKLQFRPTRGIVTNAAILQIQENSVRNAEQPNLPLRFLQVGYVPAELKTPESSVQNAVKRPLKLLLNMSAENAASNRTKLLNSVRNVEKNYEKKAQS